MFSTLGIAPQQESRWLPRDKKKTQQLRIGTRTTSEARFMSWFLEQIIFYKKDETKRAHPD